MITRITNGKVLIGDTFLETDLYFQGKTILGTEPMPCDRTVDAGGSYVTAGFIDLHCHGGGGADFTDGDPEGVCTATMTHLRHGTTTLFPTLLSADLSVLEKALDAVLAVKETLPSLAGIHLEGPYFSPAQTGAQNASALRSPKPEEYLPILEKYPIARWDYAPETDKEDTFLQALLDAGVIPAAAHTDATCDRMEAAAGKGCCLITHLYSCTSTIKREKGYRIPGVTEAAYLCDEISAELIADGCHLPHSLLRLAYKLKDVDRLALVTDGMRAAGTDTQGACSIGGVACIIEDGVAKLPDRSAFAGSVATTDRLVRTAAAAGIPLQDCVRMLTQTPAKLMKLRNKGQLASGYDADIVIFNDEIEMQAVFLQGERVV